MKFQALILAATLSVAGSAHAVNTLQLVDTYNLGSFGAPITWGDAFLVSQTGTINHSLTFNITTPLYAGSGVSDIPLSISLSSNPIYDITGLSASVFDSGNNLYASFVTNGDGDHLVLPGNSYFAAGNYTLKIGGTSAGSSGGFYSVAAATVPVPEPETWAMLLVGLGLVGYRLRQKAHAMQQEALS